MKITDIKTNEEILGEAAVKPVSDDFIPYGFDKNHPNFEKYMDAFKTLKKTDPELYKRILRME